MGDYQDKYLLAQEIGFPKDWDRTPWDVIFTKVTEHRLNRGMPAPVDNRTPVPPVMVHPKRTYVDPNRNLPSVAVLSATGAASTTATDFGPAPKSMPSGPPAKVHQQLQRLQRPRQLQLRYPQVLQLHRLQHPP